MRTALAARRAAVRTSVAAARGTTRKLVVSLGVVGSAAAVAGMGTFGTFTSTTTSAEQVNSGTVAIALGAAGSATNRLALTAANIVPGDTISRALTLTNTGDQALAAIALTTSASTSSLLDTDAVNGLQLTVTSCSVPWTEAGTSPAFTYTCSGTQGTVLASRAVITANQPLAASPALTAGGAAHLVVTMTLPQAADNTFQAKTSTIGFSFTGTQRAGTAR